jgi:hypothetical protein
VYGVQLPEGEADRFLPLEIFPPFLKTCFPNIYRSYAFEEPLPNSGTELPVTSK